MLSDFKSVKVNVWERGAGQTKACGTAACATVVAGYLRNLIENNSIVYFKEGGLEIKFDQNNKNVYMTGPVSEIKELDISL